MDLELRKLTNNVVTSSKECKPRSTNIKLIEDLEKLISYIDKKYCADPLPREEIDLLYLNQTMIMKTNLTFAATYDQASFDEEMEKLDDRIETHVLSYEIQGTLSETLRLANG